MFVHPFFEMEEKCKMIQNPVLRGFCPDPSIIRAGDDYYIAVSTFEWFPGVKIFHSRDLKNWEQIGAALTRTSQIDMKGDPTSGGVWAPCLSYDGERYYLVFTDVKTKKGRFYNTHNYLIWTDDIRKEWSDPVYLNSIGFDPSLFHDTDGKKYLINMVNGFKGVLVQEIDPETWKLVGERKKVYSGSGIGCTEGPHMYHIGEWYYLLTAEGGTGYSHCVSMARSKSIWGPFETDPENPFLTSDAEHSDALQKCGHGDLVQTPSGEWYVAHLCARAQEKLSVLGRETALQKVVFTEEGWFRLEEGGRFGKWTTEEPLENKRMAEMQSGKDAGKENTRDDFENGEEWNSWQNGYVSPRIPLGSHADLAARKGYLRLTGQESMNSLHRVTLAAKRQQELHVCAETKMDFHPICEEQLAGLAYMYDAMNFYIVGKTVDADGHPVLVLLKSDSGVITDEISAVPLETEAEIIFRAQTSGNGAKVDFTYSADGGENWHVLKAGCTTEILTDEHCRGFTGAHFGMYVHDMAGFSVYADFDYFEIKNLNQA